MRSLVIFILLLGIVTTADAGKIMVTVLDAPIFEAPDIHSKIVQTARKGAILFAHAKHFGYLEAQGERHDVDDNSDFFQTVTKDGAVAYILRKHCKRIFNDIREVESNEMVTPSEDNTDYRLPEPLPDSYPFIDKHAAKIASLIGLGTPFNQTFIPNGASINNEKQSQELNLGVSYEKRIPIDNTDRIYFGAIVEFSHSSQELTFTNKNSTHQSDNRFSVGPLISYTAYRKGRYKIDYYLALPFSFSLSTVKYSRAPYGEDSRQYTALSLYGEGGLRMEWAYKEKISLLCLAQIRTHLPYSLKGSDGNRPYLWDGPSKIDVPLDASFQLYLGVLIRE